MTNAITKIIDDVLKAEGGYVDHPDDKGGPTNWGITQATARAAGYTGHMRDLSREKAFDIYYSRYVKAPRFDQVAAVNERIGSEVIDTGVNMGPAVAARFLQRSLNALNRRGTDYADIAVDGAVGPATIGALKGLFRKRGLAAESVLLKALNALQGARYIELAEARAANESFVFGWLQNRVGMT